MKHDDLEILFCHANRNPLVPLVLVVTFPIQLYGDDLVRFDLASYRSRTVAGGDNDFLTLLAGRSHCAVVMRGVAIITNNCNMNRALDYSCTYS